MAIRHPRADELRARRAAKFADLLAETLYEQGLTHRDVAQELVIPLGTVDSWTRRRDPKIPAEPNFSRLCATLDRRQPGAGRALAAAAGQNWAPVPAAPPAEAPLPIKEPVAAAPPSLRPLRLPVPPTLLIGRERDVAVARALLSQPTVRLVTLTGPPGSGKTRLALQIAMDVQANFADGVVFIALAALAGPDLLAAAIAQALDLKEAPGAPLPDRLGDFLRGKHCLLVLDNFEHLLPAAPLVSDLLASAPRIEILITSRAALRVRGEQEIPVLPLPLPDLARLPPPDRLAQNPAVALFLARARNVQPSFALTAGNAPAVAGTCVRLDGLPLAIELAAARLRLFPPQALHDRLEQRLPLLVGGAHDLPPRQQTLRAALAWSHDLLAAEEQAVFRRLSVFVGGCTLEAAEAVAGGEGAGRDVVAALDTLVGHSLLQSREAPDGTLRFVMLETLREFAGEQLARQGEAAAAHRRHATYYLRLAEEAAPRLTSPERARWLAHLEIEHDNLRAALAWSLGADGDVTTGLRLAAALVWFWHGRGYYSEGRGWIEQLQARPMLSGYQRAQALLGTGMLAFWQGELHTSRARLEESLAHWRELSDTQSLGRTILFLSMTLTHQGEISQAMSLLEESVQILREVGDQWGLSIALPCRVQLYLQLNDSLAAQRDGEECLALARQFGDQAGIAFALNALGQVARLQKDYGRAAAYYTEALALYRQVGEKWGINWSLQNLGHTLTQLGDIEQGEALARESLVLWHESFSWQGIIMCLANLAGTAYATGRLARAARLAGATASLLETVHTVLPMPDLVPFEQVVTATQAQLGEAAFAAAWAEGQALPAERMIAYALETD